jgi:hypothetical protein
VNAGALVMFGLAAVMTIIVTTANRSIDRGAAAVFTLCLIAMGIAIEVIRH